MLELSGRVKMSIIFYYFLSYVVYFSFHLDNIIEALENLTRGSSEVVIVVSVEKKK